MERRKLLKAALALPLFAARVRAKAAFEPRCVGDIEKFRPCDGACCHQSPLRRPTSEEYKLREIFNEPNADCPCVFHDHTMQFDVNSGCRIMADRRLIDTLTEDEAKRFAEACIGYPVPYKSETMGEKDATICCWRNT